MASIRKAVAMGKPVVLLKGGRTEVRSSAASSHTGSLAGRAEVFILAARQAGAIVVDNLGELINVLKILT